MKSQNKVNKKSVFAALEPTVYILTPACGKQGWARGSFVEAEAGVEAERSRQRRGKAAMFLTEARQVRGRGRKLEAEARQSEINVVCVILKISCTMHM